MARTQIRSILSAAGILVLCSIAAAQQTPPPAEAPSTPGTQPAPNATAPPAKAPAVKPSEAPAALPDQSLVGLDVFSSDGSRVGEVRSVSTDPSGAVVALHVRTGGFLGFGSRIVAIPEGRFTRSGKSIRLDLDSDQVSNLPEVKE
jgi:hypothetical protein